MPLGCTKLLANKGSPIEAAYVTVVLEVMILQGSQFSSLAVPLGRAF